MKSNFIGLRLCFVDGCLTPSDYEFTDVKNKTTIRLGYTCDKHFDKVKKMLEEKHDTKYKA